MDKRIFNYVTECKNKLFTDGSEIEIVNVEEYNDIGNVVMLEIRVTKDGNELGRSRRATVLKEVAYNYSRSKLLKKIRARLDEKR